MALDCWRKQLICRCIRSKHTVLSVDCGAREEKAFRPLTVWTTGHSGHSRYYTCTFHPAYLSGASLGETYLPNQPQLSLHPCHWRTCEHLYMLKGILRPRPYSSSVNHLTRSSSRLQKGPHPVNMASRAHNANAQAHDFLAFVNASPTRQSWPFDSSL